MPAALHAVGPAVAEVVGQRRDVVVEEQPLLVGVQRRLQRGLLCLRVVARRGARAAVAVLGAHCYLRSLLH